MDNLEERNLTGWNLRSIFDAPDPDFMEAEAFFAAFGREHDIDGHKLICILTPPRHASQSAQYFHDSDGVHKVSAVLIVRKSEIGGLRQGGSLRIDGDDYLIAGVSSPLLEVTRLELESYGG